MRFKFTHSRAVQYTNPSFVAVPGEEYDLEAAPDELYWVKVRASKTDPTDEKGK